MQRLHLDQWPAACSYRAESSRRAPRLPGRADVRALEKWGGPPLSASSGGLTLLAISWRNQPTCAGKPKHVLIPRVCCPKEKILRYRSESSQRNGEDSLTGRRSQQPERAWQRLSIHCSSVKSNFCSGLFTKSQNRPNVRQNSRK